jgi:hypothetical protein
MSNTATSEGRKTKPVSISLETPLFNAGKRQAKKKGFKNSFSAYVSMLIERDAEPSK